MQNIEKFKSNKEEIEYLKTLFPSYPKTAYLNEDTLKAAENAQDISVTYENLIQEINKKAFQQEVGSKIISLLIQEKLDGSNAAMMFDQDKIGSKDGHIHVRNREHILRKNYLVNKDSAAKSQFLPFFNKAHSMQKSLAKLNKQCEQIVGVYGEWMYAVHSTKYDELPNDFFAFDIWLSKDKQFLDPIESYHLLQDCGFDVPYAPIVQKITTDELMPLIKNTIELKNNESWTSHYNQESTDKCEGLYIKIGNPVARISINRFKIVRQDYQSNLYWDEKKISRQKIR